MKKLFRIEYLKISSYQAFKILFAGYFLASAVLFFSLHNFSFGPFQLFGHETLKFPYVWQNVAFIGKYLNLGLGIIIALLIGNEFSFGTIRQNLIDGLSRNELVYAKYLLVLLFSLIATIFIAIIALILGYINSVVISPALLFKNIGFLFSYFIHTIGLLSIAAFIGFLFRKTAISILFFLSYTVFLEAILRSSMKADFTRYFPSKALNNLISTPYADFISGLDVPLQVSPWNIYIPVVLGYSLLFFVLTLRLMNKNSL